MYRIINSLATAEYNKEISAVEVNFNGQGNPSLYHDTMDIAMNIAVIYRTNHWLFIKDLFRDIDVDNFLLFIRKWSKQCHQSSDSHFETSPCQVALLTTADSYQHLAQRYDWLEETPVKFSNLHLRFFFSRPDAYRYLTGRADEKVVDMKTTFSPLVRYQ